MWTAKKIIYFNLTELLIEILIKLAKLNNGLNNFYFFYLTLDLLTRKIFLKKFKLFKLLTKKKNEKFPSFKYA